MNTGQDKPRAINGGLRHEPGTDLTLSFKLSFLFSFMLYNQNMTEEITHFLVILLQLVPGQTVNGPALIIDATRFMVFVVTCF